MMLKRAKLYTQVWSEPIGQIARRMGIPAAELRSCCKKMNIPVPQVGHWSQVKAGKSVSVPELLPHDGPNQLPVKVKERQSLVEWVLEGCEQAAAVKIPSRAKEVPRLEKKAPALTQAPTAKQPRYITLEEWSAATFSSGPHKNTLLRWVHEGRIQPQPKKIGRRYWVTPNAEYCSD